MLDSTNFYDKPVGNLDLNFGFRTTLFSKRTSAHFQFHIRNAAESGRLQGVAINPDGRFYSCPITDPRQFIVTTTFGL